MTFTREHFKYKHVKRDRNDGISWLFDGAALTELYHADKETSIKSLDDALTTYYKNKPGQGTKADL
jgi:hypothetical protein